ncbi:MAG: hypothetical protein ACR2OX_06905, partial [Methyloligellaceae bacterium]
YHSKFCPLLTEKLKKAQFDYLCTTSKGSRDNIKSVISAPNELAYSQLDVFALENVMHGGPDVFATIRTDIARECLFLVTKNKDFTNFGEISSIASELRFVLPPVQSGNTGTFEFLQQIDPDGLGQAKNVTYAADTDHALDEVLTSEDPLAVTIFVQFPDPDNARFKKIIEKGGHFIPVIDRNILRQEVSGEKIYFAEDTEIANAGWVQKGVKVVTACTPMVLFTGTVERLPEGKGRQDQKDLIRTVKAMQVDELRPKAGFFTKLWKSTKSLSAEGLEQMLEASEKAREQAGPMMEKAKQASKDALEKAGEMTEQARQAAKPMMEKAKEMGRKAMEKAGELSDKAADSAKEITK